MKLDSPSRFTSFYESFSDLIFGTMAIFVLLMLVFLALIKPEGNIEQVKEALDRAESALENTQAKLQQAKQEASEANARMEQNQELIKALKPQPLDLVIVLDTTYSMGEVLGDLKENLRAIIRVLQELTSELRVGFVAYRDTGEAYVTKPFPLTEMNSSGYSQLAKFIGSLGHAGGGDVPEAVDKALEQAYRQPWNTQRRGFIVVIGDAPVHLRKQKATYGLAKRFASRSPKFKITTISTGKHGGREFFRQLSRYGNGDYMEDNGAIFEGILLAVINDD